jgi:hypothetical protein
LPSSVVTHAMAVPDAHEQKVSALVYDISYEKSLDKRTFEDLMPALVREHILVREHTYWNAVF